MSDIEEETLRRDLHRRALPPAQLDIGRRSVARARRMRRRRGATVAALATLVLVVGLALGNGTQRGQLEPPPVASRPASPVSSPPRLSLDDLSAGPAPTVDYVHDGRWVRVGGDTVTLADPGSLLTSRGDGFVGFNGGLFTIRDLDPGPGERLGYSRDDGQPAVVPGVDPRIIGGVQPGPEGSILVPVVGGYAVNRMDGSWSVAKHFGDPAVPGAPPIAPTRDAVFHAQPSGSTTVVRRSELDPSAQIVDNDPWTKPVTSVPAKENLLVLVDAQGCQQVILSDPFRPAWVSCEWRVRRLAADGTHAVGLSLERGWAVVNLGNGLVKIHLGMEEVANADSFQFDASGRLNVVVRSRNGQFAIATCAMDGSCSLATAWSTTAYVLVQPRG